MQKIKVQSTEIPVGWLPKNNEETWRLRFERWLLDIKHRKKDGDNN